MSPIGPISPIKFTHLPSPREHTFRDCKSFVFNDPLPIVAARSPRLVGALLRHRINTAQESARLHPPHPFNPKNPGSDRRMPRASTPIATVTPLFSTRGFTTQVVILRGAERPSASDGSSAESKDLPAICMDPGRSFGYAQDDTSLERCKYTKFYRQKQEQ
jgi:hypothetical protein